MRIAAMTLALALLASPGLAHSQGDERPIANARGWTLTQVTGSGCFARLPGQQIDTLLAVNREGKMVVGAGRSDWKLPSGQEAVTLQIDSGAPYPIQASPVVNVIFGVVADSAMTAALRKAQRLTWTLPAGRFEANVAGLGVAFHAIRACPQPTSP
jgi:hypothetical protein